MANNIIQNKVTSAPTEKKTMQAYIKSMEGEIKKALPSVITPERFTRMVLSAISVNPKLSSCTPSSFLGAMMSAAQLGLEPNTPLGQAYILPYLNKGTLEAQFQIGYKGLIDLAYRSGEVEVIQAHVVYANDEFECEYGINTKLSHKPATKDRGEPVKVYALFKTKSGGYGFEVMSMEDVKEHAAKYSKAYGTSYSPWKTNFEEMAKKTVLKRVLKYAPLKSDFIKAVVQDGTIKSTLSEDMYDVSDECAIVNVDAEEVELDVDAETGEIK
jgi:recombination protein RecT